MTVGVYAAGRGSGGRHSRSALAGLLWGDLPEEAPGPTCARELLDTLGAPLPAVGGPRA